MPRAGAAHADTTAMFVASACCALGIVVGVLFIALTTDTASTTQYRDH